VLLHITNGDSVLTTFRQVRFPGRFLAWRDALHDGPVPQTVDLASLSDIRARALADFGWETYEMNRAVFDERDQALEDFRKFEEVVLWFEHDLYDQLQLIQLMDWFAHQEMGKIRLSVVQINSHAGIKDFQGLGQLSGSQLARLFPLRRTVLSEQLAISTDAWQAFRNATPESLVEFLQVNHPEMPFLRDALIRHCEEYPWTSDGLSRTQRQILQAVQTGAKTKEQIYLATRKQEIVAWGDLSVYLRLNALTQSPEPLLRKNSESYELTKSGQAVLDGKSDYVSLHGIDAWFGGVHLSGSHAEWRWNEAEQKLQPRKG
jgi:Domain of unknown function (DUF1835)